MLAENIENLLAKERQEARKAGQQEGREEGRKKGREEGREEVRRETARNLIMRTEMKDAVIAEIAGLSVEEVVHLRAGARH